VHDRLRIEHIIGPSWHATAQPKIQAVALVGSHAQGAACRIPTSTSFCR